MQILRKTGQFTYQGGFNIWKHVVGHLKEHYHSKTHHTNLTRWHEFRKRLKTKTAIDQINQDLMNLEVEHWRGVMHWMIAIIRHLAERHFKRAYTGSIYQYDPHNGNFLSQVEMMAQFNSVMNTYLWRIQTKQTKLRYLHKEIQNEIILVRDKLIKAIVGQSRHTW